MIKRIKMIISVIMAVAAAFSLCASAYAAEARGPVTGSKAAYCRLTFSVADKTDGEFLDEIGVKLTDIAAGIVYEYKVTAAEYLFNITSGGMVLANTTYTIELSYGDADKYAVVNEDGTEIDRFGATASGHVFHWDIIKKAAAGEAAIAAVDNGEAEIGYTDADGPVVFKKFIEAVSEIEKNENGKFDLLTQFYIRSETITAERYAKYAGGTEEEYLNFTPFEKFVHYELYTHPVMVVSYGNYDGNFSTLGKYRSSVPFTAHNIINNLCKGEKEAEAFQEIMDWQYYYFLAHGKMYNFFAEAQAAPGADASAAVNAEPVDPVKEAREQAERDRKELEEARRELIEDGGLSPEDYEGFAEDAPKKPGIWDGVIKAVKGSAVTIFILIVLGGAVAGVTIYRKRKAVKDEDDTTK